MMTPLPDAELIRRLLTAALLGALLGFEREMKQKSAGLRTNVLIAVGSAFFTVMSYELAEGDAADPSRIAAQIVTGIGFLGAGAIMRDRQRRAGTDHRGDGVGECRGRRGRGGGEYHLAFIATAVTLAALLVLQPVERFIERRSASPRRAQPAEADDDRSGERRG